MTHDLSPLLKHLNEWLYDCIIVTGSNANSQPCLFLSMQIKPIKVDHPLFYIDVAEIIYNGAIYHVRFLPGASADNIRDITKALSHYKIA